MAYQSPPDRVGARALARRQHWVVTRGQLLALGFSAAAIEHRVATARLHRVHAGVYAVGRAELSRLGQLMAVVLASGEGAALSHASGAELCAFGPRAAYEVTVPRNREPSRPGIRIHRRDLDAGLVTTQHGIPVTVPALTLVDLAPRLSRDRVERAINEADRQDLIDPERLRAELHRRLKGRRGAKRLRTILDRRTFTLTDSALERRFKPIARAAGLPMPVTREWVNGFRVDFWWPDLGLVVETDGLRYHRTPAQQAGALKRDQTHYAAGLTPLRFSHAQIRFEPCEVEGVLRDARTRLGA